MRKLAYLLVALFALFVFNPDEEAFSSHVEDESGEYLSSRAGDSKLGEILSDFGADVSKALAAHVTERNNFYFFSIYTIDLDGPDESSEEWKFLGIAGRFITLSRPEGIDED